MKHLIFCSASFHISHMDNIERENEYFFCLKQLKKMIPTNFDIVVCDNTISSIHDLNNKNLINELQNTRFMILDRNIGLGNIGMGELDQLIYVSENIDFKSYDKIVYFTLRRIVTNPWIFEKVNNMQKNALITNPPFLRLSSDYNFYYSPAADDLYNDMFFVLSSDLMINYVEYSKINIPINLQNHVGSEQNLYKFINNNQIDYDWLEHLGLIRIDYQSNKQIQLI